MPQDGKSPAKDAAIAREKKEDKEKDAKPPERREQPHSPGENRQR